MLGGKCGRRVEAWPVVALALRRWSGQASFATLRSDGVTMKAWTGVLARIAFAAVAGLVALRPAVVSAQLPQFMAVGPVTTAKEAFADIYGQLIVDELAKALRKSAEPTCFAEKRIAPDALRARGEICPAWAGDVRPDAGAGRCARGRRGVRRTRRRECGGRMARAGDRPADRGIEPHHAAGQARHPGGPDHRDVRPLRRAVGVPARQHQSGFDRLRPDGKEFAPRAAPSWRTSS